MRAAILITALIVTTSLHAQWDIQHSGTTASLRGIHSVGAGIAWASGTNGTVLRTEDGGYLWQRCTIPPGADKLDFRGIQAFDANTAIVMSSGKGDLSRLYKTTDGCQTWKLVATNPDKEGFWDAVQATKPDHADILGDAVREKLSLFQWQESEEPELEKTFDDPGSAQPGEGSFAASNSVLQIVQTPQADKTWKYDLRWASEKPGHIYFHYKRHEETATCEPCLGQMNRTDFKLKSDSDSLGIFSFAFSSDIAGVFVGGDYTKPDSTIENSAFTSDGGENWIPPTTPPHGYRSAVAYDAATKTWITVGPNGTDISTDDGKNWRALTPSPTDAPDADKNWNALSLPFVVGPHGRIGVLNPAAVKPNP